MKNAGRLPSLKIKKKIHNLKLERKKTKSHNTYKYANKINLLTHLE